MALWLGAVRRYVRTKGLGFSQFSKKMVHTLLFRMIGSRFFAKNKLYLRNFLITIW